MIHPKLIPFLKPKTIVFTMGSGWISDAIIEAQNLYWEEFGKKSRWSHIGLVGIDGRFYESWIDVTKEKVEKKFLGIKYTTTVTKMKNGVKSNPIERRFEESYVNEKFERVAFQTLNELTDEDWKRITAEMQKMEKEKYGYALVELAGTFLKMLRWKVERFFNKKHADHLLGEYNIFNNKKQVYCIAAVGDAIENATKKVYTDIENSISTVDHGIYTPMKNTIEEVSI